MRCFGHIPPYILFFFPDDFSLLFQFSKTPSRGRTEPRVLPSQARRQQRQPTLILEKKILDEYPQIALNVCIKRVHRRNKKYSINNYTTSSKLARSCFLVSQNIRRLSLDPCSHNISSHIHLFSDCKDCWSVKKRFPNIHISQVRSVQTALSMRSK